VILFVAANLPTQGIQASPLNHNRLLTKDTPGGRSGKSELTRNIIARIRSWRDARMIDRSRHASQYSRDAGSTPLGGNGIGMH
jgi:hypothetical protein